MLRRFHPIRYAAKEFPQFGLRGAATYHLSDRLSRIIEFEPDLPDRQPHRFRRLLPGKVCGDDRATLSWPLIEDDGVKEQRDRMAPSEHQGAGCSPSELSPAI
jgi:hypothetical protein